MANSGQLCFNNLSSCQIFVCRIFHHIVTAMTLDRSVTTMTSDHIMKTVILYTIVAFNVYDIPFVALLTQSPMT
jgi:hypothetical protein